MQYKYRMMEIGETSKKYGNCEICGRYVDNVYTQVEERAYKYGWTLQGCHDYFGHKECLESKRQPNAEVQIDSRVQP